MKAKSIFSFDTYKKIMIFYLSGPERRGELTRASRVLRCQRSYLSRVISENLHLTPDHAFNLASFWKLNPSERDFFLLLVEHERSGDLKYREFLKTRIRDLKQKNESVAERTERKSFNLDSHQATYFSSWAWSAIHFLTSIPEFQNVEAIADRLGLKQNVVTHFLEALEQQKFIVRLGDKWKFLTGEFHAPQNSPLVLLHHQNWRSRALLDAQNFSGESVHYTGVQTMSAEDALRIKDLLLSFLSDASRIAGPSKSEDCIVLTCDFFRV